MRSPLCLSRTIVEGEKKKTLYLSPEDREFLPLMRENFRRKYTAAYGTEPDCEISVAPCGEMRKYVTRFQQNIYVTAWQGRFSLAGPPEALDFLYQTGMPFIVALTKSDKLNRTEYSSNLEMHNEILKDFEPQAVVPFSSVKGEGADEIKNLIDKAVLAR